MELLDPSNPCAREKHPGWPLLESSSAIRRRGGGRGGTGEAAAPLLVKDGAVYKTGCTKYSITSFARTHTLHQQHNIKKRTQRPFRAL